MRVIFKWSRASAVVLALLATDTRPALSDESFWPAIPESSSAPWPGAATAWTEPVAPAIPDAGRTYDSGCRDWTTVPPEGASAVSLASSPACDERVIESTWHFRQEAYYWNERFGGADFVNERGPLSTLGYVRRSGPERFRLELFGGTVAYDGRALFADGSSEPYHASYGTDYLGVRGEYELLLEPESWHWLRAFVGVGTRFWMRNLNDIELPDGVQVWGYQETWWTVYPFAGLETKTRNDPGPQFFFSARVGATPLTYQYATYFDTVLYPRCGVTGQAELGVRARRLSLSAFWEGMTWGESAEVRGALQPASRMMTVGGKVGWTF